MKKTLLTLAAVAFLASVFTACSHYEPEPEYKNYEVDITDSAQLELGWNPTFILPGTSLTALQEDGKITIGYTPTKTGIQIKVMAKRTEADGGWLAYDGKYYDTEGAALPLSGDIYQNYSLTADDVGVERFIVIKPNADWVKLLKTGIVIQGSDATISSLVIQYIGEDLIVTNVKDFSSPAGTLDGGEVELDPDNANYSVLKVECEGDSQDVSYAFTGAADLSSATKMKITLRADYDLMADTTTGIVSKVSNFTTGDYINGFVVYNIYTHSVSDGTIVDEVTKEAVPAGALYNSYWKNKAIKISDYYSDYEDKDALAYGMSPRAANAGVDKSVHYPGLTKEEAEHINWTVGCMGYVYTKQVTEDNEADRIAVEVDNRMKITLISKGKDKDGKDKDYVAVYAFPGGTSFAAEYPDDAYELKIEDFEADKDFDIKKVTGYKLTTGTAEGTLYIKSITFE